METNCRATKKGIRKMSVVRYDLVDATHSQLDLLGESDQALAVAKAMDTIDWRYGAQ